MRLTCLNYACKGKTLYRTTAHNTVFFSYASAIAYSGVMRQLTHPSPAHNIILKRHRTAYG